MSGAFLYLSVCSLRNRLRVRLRRLRQPRYLIGSIVGLAYLYFFAFRRPGGRSARVGAGGAPTPLAVIERIGEWLEVIGAVLLFLGTALAWVLPGAGRPIEFSRSEVQFLFPAPVSRRQLLHYKLVRGQIGPMFGSAVATLFLRPSSFAAGWTFLVGMWLLFAVMRLHFIGIALRRQSLAQHGRAGLSRNWLPMVIVAGAVLVLAGTVAADWPRLSTMPSSYQVFRELLRLGATGLAHWVLWPFAAIVRLPLSGSVVAFLRALPPVLLLLAINYLWVLRGDLAFEEASAADAERRAAERAAPRALKRTARAAPFALALSGPPETAILWKNLILLGRYASSRTLVRLVPALIAVVVAFSNARGRTGITAFISGLGLMAAAMTVMIGPQILRNDCRQDLAQLAVLKTWPVRGPALVRGELLAPAVVLTVLTWVCVVLGVALFPGRFPGVPVGADRPPIGSAAEVAVAAALLAPGLILAQLVLQNGLAILFPGWVAIGASRARGLDAFGQRLLMMAGIVLALALSLVPGLLAGGLVGAGLYLVGPRVQMLVIVVPALIAAIVMLAECWIAADLLGRVFDRTDVSAVEAGE